MSGKKGEWNNARMPSDVTPKLSFFDRFATRASAFVSRAWFFASCVLLVIVWAPSFVLLGSIDTWQLVINTVTTIITFLLVALLQNTQTRTDEATEQKLNAIAKALAELSGHLSKDYPELGSVRKELRAAVGLEDRESA